MDALTETKTWWLKKIQGLFFSSIKVQAGMKGRRGGWMQLIVPERVVVKAPPHSLFLCSQVIHLLVLVSARGLSSPPGHSLRRVRQTEGTREWMAPSSNLCQFPVPWPLGQGNLGSFYTLSQYSLCDWAPVAHGGNGLVIYTSLVSFPSLFHFPFPYLCFLESFLK